MVAEQFDEWAKFPSELNAQRQDGWMNGLLVRLRRLADRVQTLETNTTTLTVGTSGITFAPNVANLGAGFRAARTTITSDGRINTRGVINNNSGGIIAAGTALMQVPAGYRPSSTEITYGVTALSGGVIRMDMNNVGQIYLQVGWAIGDFLAFNFVYDAA